MHHSLPTVSHWSAIAHTRPLPIPRCTCTPDVPHTLTAKWISVHLPFNVPPPPLLQPSSTASLLPSQHTTAPQPHRSCRHPSPCPWAYTLQVCTSLAQGTIKLSHPWHAAHKPHAPVHDVHKESQRPLVKLPQQQPRQQHHQRQTQLQQQWRHVND